MVRTFALAALPLAASAATMAIPRIELNMAAMGARVEKHVVPIYHKHDLAAVQPDGNEVTSVQDWTERCPVQTSNAQNCPQPSATAWDHHNGKLDVQERLFLIDSASGCAPLLFQNLLAGLMGYTIGFGNVQINKRF